MPVQPQERSEQVSVSRLKVKDHSRKTLNQYGLTWSSGGTFCVYCCFYRYELNIREDRNQMEARRLPNHQFYVWDHVAVALHVENTEVPSLTVLLSQSWMI
ncbi:hypothetical protein ILYODFUR_037456 [Ilyodon furcidens]|uniref:Uncharacterized protein n=1 Tax=Ilyodon furcidens TaxID=33524 RepID=A0ABV0TFI7_9TELE